MGMFRLYDCDVSLTIRGQTYTFDHVDSLAIEDNERTKLIRGSNAGNDLGLVYREGLKEPKVVTVTVIDIPMDLHNLLKDVYKTRERIDCNCISRVDGSAKIAKNGVLSQAPRQLTLDDSPESLNVALVIESFNIDEVLKS